MTATTDESIALVTYSRNHESPSEYHAFDSRAAAIEWLEQQGVDEDDLEWANRPGGDHWSAKDPDDDRWNYSIRELEVRGGDC